MRSWRSRIPDRKIFGAGDLAFQLLDLMEHLALGGVQGSRSVESRRPSGSS